MTIDALLAPCLGAELLVTGNEQEAPDFVVALQDYYGSQGLAEYSGTCQVHYNGSALTLPELGRVVGISNGTSDFQQLVVQGTFPSQIGKLV